MTRRALLCLLTTSPLAERIGPSPTGERWHVFFPSGDLAGVVTVPPEDHVPGDPVQVEAHRATDAEPVRCRVLSHDRTPLGEVDVTEMQAAAAEVPELFPVISERGGYLVLPCGTLYPIRPARTLTTPAPLALAA